MGGDCQEVVLQPCHGMCLGDVAHHRYCADHVAVFVMDGRGANVHDQMLGAVRHDDFTLGMHVFALQRNAQTKPSAFAPYDFIELLQI